MSVSFDDAAMERYNIRAAQTDNGNRFAVTAVDGKTTVRLGAANLTLDTVALAHCASTTGIAKVIGANGATLSIQIELVDSAGRIANSVTSTCVYIGRP